MSGTRVEIGRIVALGSCLALALLLLSAAEASGEKYAVAQCGWHVGADADWADSTGGAKFRPDAWCATPAGADPFEGAHMKSFGKGGGTVSGTRFARWRWQAPPGTGITRVSGTWWHALHDGMEQRIGVATAGGGFEPFASAGVTDVTPRTFVAGFAAPRPALEDRLLCARTESRWCSLDPPSWSAVRALTITVQDDGPPSAAVGGELVAGGWRHGAQRLSFSGADGGSGVRFGETMLDGARVALTEHTCAKAMIGGEWRATRMRPCATSATGSATVATPGFSDGPHTLGHCATDFAGSVACVAPRTVLIDNNAPSQPRRLAVAGGEGWRRAGDFDLSWENPGQGAASPIGGAHWRITGPAGFDSGTSFAAERDVAALADLSLPRAGAYVLHLWLRDEAGNADPSAAAEAPLRFDDEPPAVAFEPPAAATFVERPDAVVASVEDVHSGPDSGEIQYRRRGRGGWVELPARLRAERPGRASLAAPLPADLAPGAYAFRAVAIDAAGNVTSTTRRADGAEMALRVTPPAKTRIFARLEWRRRHGSRLTLPFGSAARLAGRLVTAAGTGLAGRRLRVVSRPSRGALSRPRVETVSTGAHGGFRLALPAGPSRRITVGFAGEPGLAPARRTPLTLRVRGRGALHAGPLRLSTGAVLRLWGGVGARAAALPRRGKVVAIQYYEEEARRWRPVLVTRSDHAGHFRARYRFRYVTGSARIRLRALALAEERWPYAPGASRPITVRVKG